MARKRYKIISEDLQKNLIEFLDEIQFDATKEGSVEDMHKVNFCNWAISELLNGYDTFIKDTKNNPNKKSRQDYVDETFLDWNLPDMSEKDFEKLVDNFDNFLRAWEKEYNKKNPKKKSIEERPKTEFKPRLDDVAEHCSLEEIKDMLKDDSELSDYDRFELYYEERERRKQIKNSLTYDELLKQTGFKTTNKTKKK